MNTEIINNCDGSSTETDFDEIGNEIEVRDLSNQGAILRMVRYHYDRSRTLIRWDEFRKGILTFRYIIESSNGVYVINVYDNNGALTETTPLESD